MKCGWLAVLAAGVLGLAGQPARAAMAGAWETFYNEQNTNAWFVYDYADGISYIPFWSGTPVDEEYAYFTYSEDYQVGFVADDLVGTGEFTGDYPAQRIGAIACDVYIGDLTVLDFVDCTLYADGPFGKQLYVSAFFGSESFSEGGWWSLSFSFDQPWFYLDGDDIWQEVDARTLTAVEQLEIRFTPILGSAGGSEVGLDDVTLEPTVAAPELVTSVTTATPRNFQLAFTPGPGLECRVEQLKTPPAAGWEAVTGQTGIKGPGQHVFLTPAGPNPEFFRVGADPFYTLVFSE